MDKKQFEQLIVKLNTLTKITALSVIQNKPLKDQVVLLNSTGMSITEIANIVGKKRTDIGQYIYRKKKSKKKL